MLQCNQCNWIKKASIKGTEFELKKYIQSLDTRSDEEKERDSIRKGEEQEEYYFQCPEKFETLLKNFEIMNNKTEEEIMLESLERYILSAFYDPAYIPKFDKLDINSDKTREFFKRCDVQKELFENPEKKNEIIRQLGRTDWNIIKKLK